MKTRFNPVDIHVGSRVRLRRLILGISQEKLGEQLSVTFQQVQKYEKGANRIGASRLFAISQILTVPVQFFFEDMPSELQDADPDISDAPPNVTDFVATSEGLALNLAFSRIKDRATRKHLSELVQSVANQTDD